MSLSVCLLGGSLKMLSVVRTVPKLSGSASVIAFLLHICLSAMGLTSLASRNGPDGVQGGHTCAREHHRRRGREPAGGGEACLTHAHAFHEQV